MYSSGRKLILIVILINATSVRAIGKDEFSKPITWSFELPASTTIAPFSQHIFDDFLANKSVEPLKQSISENTSNFVNTNSKPLSEPGQHRASQAAAASLKPWPSEIKWSLPQTINERKVTFLDGLNNTIPWMRASTSDDWSLRTADSLVTIDPIAKNHQYVSQQQPIYPQLSSNPQQDQTTDFSFLNNVAVDTSPNQIQGNTMNAHALNYLNLLTRPSIHTVDSTVSSLDWLKFLSTNELAQQTGDLSMNGLQYWRPTLDKQLSSQKTQNFHNISNKLTGRSAWLKTFAPKRRSYEVLSDGASQYNLDPRMSPTSVYFDDSNDAMSRPKELEHHAIGGYSQLKTNKDYLSPSYAAALPPMIYEAGPVSIERKNFKLDRTHDDQFSSLVDSLTSGSKYSVSASAPSLYAPSYPAVHHIPHHTTHRKGLEKALGVPILVGIGAALISFLIISNLFLSIPLFAMTLMQLLNGSPMLMPPNNNNGNNQIPNNNNNNQTPNNQNTNGRRRRRDVQDIEFDERIQKVLSDGRY